MAGNYLKQSRPGTPYQFRRRVPDDVRGVLGKLFLVKSLGTTRRREAIILARVLAFRTDYLFQRIRTMPSSDDNIRIDLILKVDFNELGGLKSVHIEADNPDEQKQAEVMLTNVLDKVVATPSKQVGIPFSEAMDRYLKDQRKATTRETYRGRLKHAKDFFGAIVLKNPLAKPLTLA